MKFCEKPFNFFYTLPGGDVWPCGWMHYKIGNLMTQTTEEIWNSEEAKKARESIIDGSFRYCRKESCPFLENDSLPDLSEEEFKKLSVPTDGPIRFNNAFDFTCNHLCPSCRDKIFIRDEKYVKGLNTIIDKLMPYYNKATEISSCGNGEVLASPELMRMLASLKPINKDLQVILESNGALFNQEHWDKISNLGSIKLKVIITPNSFEKNTFKYLSGNDDDVENLTNNLNFIKKLRHEGKVNYYAISIVVQDRNFRELPAFTKRCLEEFDVDEVTVKPVYQWFGMKEETYWFKNVRNPLHPYHKEYMEMIKDPVFDDKRVFFWGSRYEETAPKVHPAYKYKTSEETLINLIKLENPEKDICSSILNMGGAKVAVLTPENEIGMIAEKMLEKGGIKPVCFVQRFEPKKPVVNNLKVFGFPSMDFNSVDTIIITENYEFEKLSADIRNHHFKGNILSFDKLVSSLHE